MKKTLMMMLIAVEAIMLIALILADVGVIELQFAPLSAKSIIAHITAIVMIIVCVDIYKKG